MAKRFLIDGSWYEPKSYTTKEVLDELFNKFGDTALMLTVEQYSAAKIMMNMGWNIVGGLYGTQISPNISWFSFDGLAYSYDAKKDYVYIGKAKRSYYACVSYESIGSKTPCVKIYKASDKVREIASFPTVHDMNFYFSGMNNQIPAKEDYSSLTERLAQIPFPENFNDNLIDMLSKEGAIKTNVEIDFNKLTKIQMKLPGFPFL